MGTRFRRECRFGEGGNRCFRISCYNCEEIEEEVTSEDYEICGICGYDHDYDSIDFRVQKEILELHAKEVQGHFQALCKTCPKVASAVTTTQSSYYYRENGSRKDPHPEQMFLATMLSRSKFAAFVEAKKCESTFEPCAKLGFIAGNNVAAGTQAYYAGILLHIHKVKSLLLMMQKHNKGVALQQYPYPWTGLSGSTMSAWCLAIMHVSDYEWGCEGWPVADEDLATPYFHD